MREKDLEIKITFNYNGVHNGCLLGRYVYVEGDNLPPFVFFDFDKDLLIDQSTNNSGPIKLTSWINGYVSNDWNERIKEE
jgi:hypothetical protein